MGHGRRLIRTGLDDEAQQRLVGERGESDVYRALIVQLAIATGAPPCAIVPSGVTSDYHCGLHKPVSGFLTAVPRQ